MNFKTLRALCKPVQVFLLINLLIILVMIYQNRKYNSHTFCFGDHICDVESKGILLLSNLIYTVFWAFILNLMCKSGYKRFAWLLVLFPLILFFIFLGIFMLLKGSRRNGFEGFEGLEEDDELKKKKNSNTDSVDELMLDEDNLHEKTLSSENDEIQDEIQENSKEGFWGMEPRHSMNRRRDGSCMMGNVTGANLSNYPSQFNNDYYAQI